MVSSMADLTANLGEWPSFGKYGFYILFTYGLTLLLMLLEPLVLKAQRKTILKNINRLLKIGSGRNR